jgi:hypothetical protein
VLANVPSITMTPCAQLRPCPLSVDAGTVRAKLLPGHRDRSRERADRDGLTGRENEPPGCSG